MSEPHVTLPRRGFLARVVAAATGGALLARGDAQAAEAQIDDQPYVGEIRLFAGNTPPNGWMFCQGQLLDPNGVDTSTLFNLIGTSYGGDGQFTFALPDLRSRVPVHVGAGYVLGQTGGVETVTLTTLQIPAHVHAMGAGTAPGVSADPTGAVPARNAAGALNYAAAATTDLSPTALQFAGGSQPHPNMQPYLGLNFMICLAGIYPPST